ncbi:regulatory protein RecX [Pseudonocardiaceae bacterium YIM PH 21723]|nr:regulatory protein RecX [Pseudonocardiaceae bacterium YIM PH 21723]
MRTEPDYRAKDIALRQLAVKPRTRAELEQALSRKEVEPDVAARVLDKLEAAGLINDAEFADSWVRQRHAYSGLGSRALKYELRRKGVADEVITEAVSDVDAEAEEERAIELVRKKMRSMRGLDSTTQIRRLVGMLARKGYAEGMAYRVVRSELKAADEDTEPLG